MAKGEELVMIFWEQFWPQLIATLFGVGVGIPAGVALNRLIEGITENEKREKILSLLKVELELNLSELVAWKSRASGDLVAGILGVKLNDEAWSAFSEGGELQWIKDPSILFALSNAYFELKAVQNYSKKHYDITIIGGIGVNPRYMEFIFGQLEKAVDNAEVTIRETIPMLKTSLSKVSRFKLFIGVIMDRLKRILSR